MGRPIKLTKVSKSGRTLVLKVSYCSIRYLVMLIGVQWECRRNFPVKRLKKNSVEVVLGSQGDCSKCLIYIDSVMWFILLMYLEKLDWMQAENLVYIPQQFQVQVAQGILCWTIPRQVLMEENNLSKKQQRKQDELSLIQTFVLKPWLIMQIGRVP